jgi:hypothetical protein
MRNTDSIAEERQPLLFSGRGVRVPILYRRAEGFVDLAFYCVGDCAVVRFDQREYVVWLSRPASWSDTLCSGIAMSSSVSNPNSEATSGGNPSATSQQCAIVRAE